MENKKVLTEEEKRYILIKLLKIKERLNRKVTLVPKREYDSLYEDKEKIVKEITK